MKIVRIAAASAALFLAIGSATPAADPVCPVPTAVAHRGLSEAAPENTLAAFYAAAASGVPMIEMDLRYLTTGGPVVMHDATVNRTTDGTGRVDDKTWTQFKKLSAGEHVGEVAYDGEHPPSWVQALLELKPFTGVTLVPEIKGTRSNTEIAAFIQRIDSRGVPRDRVIATSFRESNLTKLGAQAPDMPLGLLDSSVSADPVADAQAVGADYYMPRHDDLTADDVSDLHAAGIEVIVWTADDPARWESLAAMQVDAIITNRAAVYQGWASARC